MNLEENEIAKPIEGYEGLYLITNFGRVWSVKSKKFISQRFKKNGYVEIHISKDNSKKYFRIHRLIAIHFIENPKPNEYNIIDHINHHKTDNRISNLRWCNNELNNRNAQKYKNTSSKYKGVSYDKSRNKWTSRITINKIRKSLGSYFTEEEAANAYNQYIIDNKLEEFFILNDL